MIFCNLRSGFSTCSRLGLVVTLLLPVSAPVYAADTLAAQSTDTKPITVAAYYFPQWHVDPQNEARKGARWTEWELIKSAKPKFPGHSQPKIPSWGYQMEDTPDAMAQKISAATSHGVEVFIFDWYYHEKRGAFLSNALDKGFLKASNREQIKFAIMWANHGHQGEPGELSREAFDKMSAHFVADYFKDPGYWKIDGKAYFSIYQIDTFIKGLGGIDNARLALEGLRMRAMAAGLKGVHLNIVDYQLRGNADPTKLLNTIGADSVTTYTWIHVVPLKQLGFPTVDYMEVASRYMNYEKVALTKYKLPYHPNITMGWDPTPRMDAQQKFDGRGYPNTPVIVGNTPQNFAKILDQVKQDLVKAEPSNRIVTINAWNEWGEGAYLEPDTVNGLGYLNAIKDVFGSGDAP